MDQAREVETKLEVPSSFALPDLRVVKGVSSLSRRSRTLRAHYLDTTDLRLAASGATLRHRTGEGRARWTLKLGGSTSKGLERQELSVPGRATQPPAALTGLLVAHLRGMPLQTAVELTTRRTSVVLCDGEGRPLVDVVDDRVQAVQPSGEQVAWRELEVELCDATGRQAKRAYDRVLAALAEAGAPARDDQTPKALRALGVQPTAPVTVRRKDSVGELVRASLTLRMAQLREHDVGVRLDVDDAVHQFRVTCRRMRTDLRTFQPFLNDPRAEVLRAELTWLAGSFGRARDLEVLRARLRRTAADAGAPLDVTPVDALLAADQADAVAACLETLASSRYVELLDLLAELSASIGLSDRASEACADALPGLVDKTWDALVHKAQGLEADRADTGWHQARIAAKRARYAAETALAVRGPASWRTRARRAEKAQDLLGEHQDACVRCWTWRRGRGPTCLWPCSAAGWPSASAPPRLRHAGASCTTGRGWRRDEASLNSAPTLPGASQESAARRRRWLHAHR